MVAGAYLIVLREEFQQVSGMHDRTVRPEIPVSLHDSSGEIDFRELIPGYAYPRIGLGVLEKDIVLRLVLFDEIILKQQCVSLSIDHRILRIRYLGDKYPRLGIEPLRGHEILRHALVEVLRLAYIYDNPLGVIIPVNSGGMRKQCYFFSYCQCLSRDYFLTYLATSSSIDSPWRPLLMMVPSGPKRMM